MSKTTLEMTAPPAVRDFPSPTRFFNSLVTVLGLLAVGWLGHSTHWTFQFHSVSHGSPEEHVAEALVDAKTEARPKALLPQEGGCVIDFGTPEGVEHAGISTAKVTQRNLVQAVSGTGLISYDERHVAQLAPRVTGTIWRVEKHLGENVKKGDVLAIVDSESVGKFKAEFLNSLVALDTLEEVYERLILIKDAIPTRQIREVHSQIREARIRLLNAEQSLVNLGFPLDKTEFVSLSDTERGSRIRVLGLPESLINGSSASLLSSNLVPLIAPFDGVVINREAVAGEVVEPGRCIFELADNSQMWITLDISKEDLSLVKLDQPIYFQPDGLETELCSKIDWMNTELNEETRTLKVRATVENPETSANSRLLRANTYGHGRIVIHENPTANVVPRDAIQWDGQNHVLFVQESPSRFAGRVVKPGLHDQEFVELLDGPATGTPIALEGSHQLKSEWQLRRTESASN